MAEPITFRKLWNGAPLNNSEQTPCRLPRDIVTASGTVLRGLPSYHNQCAIRVGVALGAAGLPADALKGVIMCEYHGREAMHCLNAQQTADALSRLPLGSGVGPVEKLVGADAAQFYPRLIGRTGLIFFKDYWYRSVPGTGADGQPTTIKEKAATGDHIDVWNGYRSSAAWVMQWFSWLGYYSNYAQSKEVWFWEVK